MNLHNHEPTNEHSIRLHHTDPNVVPKVTEQLLNWFPKVPREYIVVCIGTDRSTGDSLGPLTGTFLAEKRPRNLTVYGTIHDPVHATNLESYLEYIKDEHDNPFIIAVDACLGRNISIGQITAEQGPVKPGAALDKNLPDVGDIHLTGIVNISGFMEYTILQSTRLSIVLDMAKQLADILQKIDDNLTFEKRLSSIVFTRRMQRPFPIRRKRLL